MVTFQSQTQGMRSVAKRIRPMRCLPSSTTLVANADCAELQHLAGFARAVPETYKTPLQPNMLAGRRWFTH
jgi:hypothetical protein